MSHLLCSPPSFILFHLSLPDPLSVPLPSGILFPFVSSSSFASSYSLYCNISLFPFTFFLSVSSLYFPFLLIFFIYRLSLCLSAFVFLHISHVFTNSPRPLHLTPCFSFISVSYISSSLFLVSFLAIPILLVLLIYYLSHCAFFFHDSFLTSPSLLYFLILIFVSSVSIHSSLLSEFFVLASFSFPFFPSLSQIIHPYTVLFFPLPRSSFFFFAHLFLSPFPLPSHPFSYTTSLHYYLFSLPSSAHISPFSLLLLFPLPSHSFPAAALVFLIRDVL